ncbi:hypothetical protein KAR91_38910 [Candidatus Pacearchaeota archaeon]|nr:hypothetical protein [Candidatus Pacearchaeota archaeon]
MTTTEEHIRDATIAAGVFIGHIFRDIHTPVKTRFSAMNHAVRYFMLILLSFAPILVDHVRYADTQAHPEGKQDQVGQFPEH